MPESANDAAVDLHAAGRPFERATGSIGDVAALPDGWMHTQLELLGHCDLDLGIVPRRTEHANAFDPAFWSDDGELFLAGVLAGLGKIGVLRELMARSEE